MLFLVLILLFFGLPSVFILYSCISIENPDWDNDDKEQWEYIQNYNKCHPNKRI